MRIKYLLLVGLLFLFSDCQKDDLTVQKETKVQDLVNEHISGDDAPDVVSYLDQLFNSESLKLGQLNLPFDKKLVDKKTIAKVKDPDTGYTNFTFAVKRKKKDNFQFQVTVTKYGKNDFSDPYIFLLRFDDAFRKKLNKGNADWNEYVWPIYPYRLSDAAEALEKATPTLSDCQEIERDDSNNSGGGGTYEPGGHTITDPTYRPHVDAYVIHIYSPDLSNCSVNTECYDDWLTGGDDDPCPDPPSGGIGIILPSISDIDDVLNQYLAPEVLNWLNSSENLLHRQQVNTALAKFIDDPVAIDAIIDHVNNINSDSEYKEFVEATLSWGPVMWSIAKELLGDKAVDLAFQLIPGFGQADEVRDAFKAAKNGDWLEFIAETSKIIAKETPWGKWIKVLDIGDDLIEFYKKVDKLADKVGAFADDVLEQMWDVAKKFPESVKLNPTLLEGLAKAAKRGVKSVNSIKAAVPNFTALSENAIEHIFRGNGGPTGGLHHISGILADSNKKILEVLEPNARGVYKARIEFPSGEVKWKTFFPDSKSEIGIAKAIENVFDSPSAERLIENNTKRLIEGIDASGLRIDIVTDLDYNIISAYPIRD